MEGLEQGLLTAARRLEAELDARLDATPEEELATLRQKRLQEFRERQLKMEQWRKNGHGQYGHLADEREFFDATKASSNVVCHFYRDDEELCRVFDMHLGRLAAKHMEARFCRLNAARAPFLIERLRIRGAPTVVLVRNSKTTDYVVGLRDLGGKPDFATEVLERRLAVGGVIEVEETEISAVKKPSLKIIRGREEDSSDSE
ncbi:thioredoxin domain-containing protein 9 [Phlebotomus argentipes]|uniref:thioredoxin domain-containing protein 9 n=1 Tax=Phlebotomus argentipes TaxID=94469 RepID=UPI0028935DD7|nr:thioredoxin domain-containing protein 9 [Phlebotomus argentipes]